MARTFRRQRQSHPIAELNVTNLIDLGFMLLIIFMITTPLITHEQNIPINLPTQSKTPQTQRDKDLKLVIVSIDAKGNYFFNETSTPITFAQLTANLKSVSSDPKKIAVRIRADGAVPYQKFISVVDELKKLNLSRIDLGTQTK